MIPGEIIPGDGPVSLNEGRPVRTLIVVNTGDRPVQVGTAVRFEPGVQREVELVPLAGARIVPGLRLDGTLDGAINGAEELDG